MPAAKVLVADAPEMDEKIRECLPERELVFVRTMSEAIRGLRQESFQLVVIGLNFDESRMLDLLQYVHALAAYKDVPVICVHGDHLNLSEAVMKNIDVAVKALGGVAFLDLRDGALDYHQDCGFLGRVAAEGTPLSPN